MRSDSKSINYDFTYWSFLELKLLCGWTQFVGNSVSRNCRDEGFFEPSRAVIFTDEYFWKCFVGKRSCIKEKKIYELYINVCAQKEKGCTQNAWGLVVLKGSGCCFKSLTAFGGISVKWPLLSLVWLAEGGKRFKKWRNYGQKLSSKKSDFSSMSSFQVVFLRWNKCCYLHFKGKKTWLTGKISRRAGDNKKICFV